MRDPRVWSMGVLAALLLALGAAWPAIAQAAARVTSPSSWSESSNAAPEAQRRAGHWKDALGLRLVQVVSAPDDDRFAETIAVFERTAPIPEQAFADDAAAIAELSRTVLDVVGSQPPETGGLRATASDEQVAWARWVVDDLTYECVLAPSGGTATVVIMAVPTDELDELRETLDGVVAGLEGVTAPMPRFSLLGWRLGALLVWAALGVALHAGMLRLVDLEDDHAIAGRRAALVNLAFVVAGTLLAHFLLAGREMAIVYAGSSLGGLTMWIALAGIIVVGAHLSIASRLDRGVVQSAPSSGAFASGTYSTAEVLRSRTSGIRPRVTDLSESSGSWPSPPKPAPGPSVSDPGSSGRIIIDEAERE